MRFFCNVDQIRFFDEILDHMYQYEGGKSLQMVRRYHVSSADCLYLPLTSYQELMQVNRE